MEGGEQVQRCAEVGAEDGESEGRMRNTSSAAEDSNSRSAGTVSSRSRAAEALDGSAIGGGMDRKIGDLVSGAAVALVWFHHGH